jgi:hypothetical protein
VAIFHEKSRLDSFSIIRNVHAAANGAFLTLNHIAAQQKNLIGKNAPSWFWVTVTNNCPHAPQPPTSNQVNHGKESFSFVTYCTKIRLRILLSCFGRNK